MAAARFGEGAALPIIGSLVLHIVLVGLLVAGRTGPEQPAASVATRDAASQGEATVPVDLRSFRGAHKPGRSAPDDAADMTAAAAPGVPDTLRGASLRTIVPTEPSPLSPPGLSEAPPPGAGTTPSLVRRAAQGGVSESRPVVRTLHTTRTAEPGASDLAVAAMAASRTPVPGMPALKVQPIAPVATAAPPRPASPDPGAVDQTLMPSSDTVPAPVADAPRPAVVPDIMLQTTTSGAVPGPGISNRTTIPLDVMAVPTPPKPVAPPKPETAALPPLPPPKPATAKADAPVAAKPAPRPKPRVARPPPPVEPTPDMVVIPPDPAPVVAMPAPPAPLPPAASTPRRRSRAADPFESHGINGEGGGGSSVGVSSTAADGSSASGAGTGTGSAASGSGAGSGGSGPGGGAGGTGAGSGGSGGAGGGGSGGGAGGGAGGGGAGGGGGGGAGGGGGGSGGGGSK